MAHSDRPVHRNLNGGEQSPYLDPRADLARWKTSLRTMENFCPIVQGGATRCPGTIDVGAAQDNSRLLRFVFSENDGYAVEAAANPGKLRFYRDFGVLLNGAGPALYEVDSPYTAGEVAALSYTQATDSVYLSCGTKTIKQLKRLDTNDWTLTDVVFKNGPFMDQNLDDTFTLTTSASGELTPGTDVPLTASAALFNALHVGALFLIKVKDQGKHPIWQAGVGSHVGDIVVWNGNWYICTDDALGTKTGPEPPVHLYGECWDGNSGVSGANARKWKYLHSGWGVVQITGYTSPTSADATVISYCPDDLESGTWQWAEGAWSDYRGYPRLIGLHKKRLYALGTKAQPTTAWASKIDDYTNMDAQLTDADHAFVFTLEDGSGEVNFPQWIVSGNKLAVGTSGPEFVIGSSDATQAIAPLTVDPQSATSEGSANVPAIKIDTPVFTSKDGRRIHVLGIGDTGDYEAPDLTIEAEHITQSGVQELSWAREPYRLLWCRRGDGALATMVYRKDESINGWFRRTFYKGAVKSICAVPSPTGIRSDVWMIVERPLVAGTVRRIECMAPFFERGDNNVVNGVFLDGARQYSGMPTSVLGGIDACYIGETFRVLADGQVRADCKVVSDGAGGAQITLDRDCVAATFGLSLVAYLETLPYDKSLYTGDVIGGQLSGKKSRPTHLTVSAIRSAGVEAAMVPALEPDEDPIADENLDYVALYPSGGAPSGAPARLNNGISEDLTMPDGWSSGGTVRLRCKDPLPATITAIAPNFQVAG